LIAASTACLGLHDAAPVAVSSARTASN